jgi:iron complex outermembrane receptor protein
MMYTFARYRFVEDPTYKGNDIPGAPRHHASVELRYAHPSGLAVAPMVEWVPQRFYVNSANTATNSGWTTLALRVEWTSARLGLTAFAAGQNLTDRRFAQSVQVDNAAGRYYEPADPRAFYAGVRWAP